MRKHGWQRPPIRKPRNPGMGLGLQAALGAGVHIHGLLDRAEGPGSNRPIQRGKPEASRLDGCSGGCYRDHRFSTLGFLNSLERLGYHELCRLRQIT
ncbi:hypothetical protein ACFX2I_015051 [Malus domestica]